MASGLAIPVRAVVGRAALASGDTQMHKLIALALASGESNNPFNGSNVGMKTTLWTLDGPAARAMIQRTIELHFKRWEADGRAQLIDVTFQKVHNGEVQLFIHYVDLETDEQRAYEQAVPQRSN